MKKDKLHDSGTVNDEFLINEYHTNKTVTAFLIGFIILAAVNCVMLYVHNDLITLNIFIHSFTPINASVIAVIILAAVNRFEKPWIKNMLLVAVTLVTAISFFLLTTYAMYMVFLPIFIATRYFNKKTIITVSVVTALLFFVSCILNVLLEPVSDVIDRLHINSSYNIWQSMTDTVAYYIVPCLLTMFIMTMFGLNITLNGGKLIASGVEKTHIIAEVDAEINTAATIQKSVLPAPRFTSPDGHFDLCAYESPAREVCGDFYDYFMLNDTVLAVIVADVSDKGLPAAMFMMSAKKVLQAALLSNHSLADAVALANKLICNDNQSDMFLTLWMGLIDTKSGVGKYINAGHPYPVIKHKNGEITFIENEPDLFIGNFPAVTPRVHTFRLNEDDTLVIYTDGLTDATDKNGNAFTLERVTQAVGKSNPAAEDTVSAVTADVHAFSNDKEPFDDITVLALHCATLTPPAPLHLTENADASGTATINDTVMEAVKQAGCPDDVRRKIGVAVDEICNNISEYAYPEKNGKTEFSALLYNNCIEMTFIDNGQPFNPLLQEDPSDDGVIRIGGLGIYFVKQLSDGLSYEYKDGQNRVGALFIWDI